MIFDIRNPLYPGSLMRGRAQTRGAWRLPLIQIINKVGDSREGSQFRRPLPCRGIGSSGCLSYFVFCQSVKSGDAFATGLKRFDKASIVSLGVTVILAVGAFSETEIEELNLDDATLQSDGHGVGSIVGAKFRQNLAHVCLNRFLGDFEMVSNDLVGVARSYLPQDVDFSLG
jgi:hypothetical protein